MRGGPEGIAADRAVPRDIPVSADGDGGDGEGGTPEVPGDLPGQIVRRKSRHLSAFIYEP